MGWWDGSKGEHKGAGTRSSALTGPRACARLLRPRRHSPRRWTCGSLVASYAWTTLRGAHLASRYVGGDHLGLVGGADNGDGAGPARGAAQGRQKAAVRWQLSGWCHRPCYEWAAAQPGKRRRRLRQLLGGGASSKRLASARDECGTARRGAHPPLELGCTEQAMKLGSHKGVPPGAAGWRKAVK